MSALLADGRMTAATLDDKIRRQLRVAFELGWFDRAQKDDAIPHDDPASYAVNVEEARGGITLLKNADNLLPLDPAKAKHVVVVGPNSDHPVIGGGGSACVSPSHAVSVLDALRHIGGDNVVSRLVWGSEDRCPPMARQVCKPCATRTRWYAAWVSTVPARRGRTTGH